MKATSYTKLRVCLEYGAASTLLTIVNRILFRSHHFNFPLFLSFLHLVTVLVLAYMFSCCKIFPIKPLQSKVFLRVLPLTIFWFASMVSSIAALQHLPISTSSTLRRAVLPTVAVGEYLAFKSVPSWQKCAAMASIVFAATAAGFTDLSFDIVGYTWSFVGVVSTACYLILIRRLNISGIDQNTLLAYNTVLALPFSCLLLLCYPQELEQILLYPWTANVYFLPLLLFSCILAFFINLCIFRCSTINSPLATSVTGQIKDVATIAFGTFVLKDGIFTLSSLVAVVVGLLGSAWYFIESLKL